MEQRWLPVTQWTCFCLCRDMANRFSLQYFWSALHPDWYTCHPITLITHTIYINHDKVQSVALSSFMDSTLSIVAESNSVWIDCTVGERFPSSTERKLAGEDEPLTSSCRDGGVCSTSFANAALCPFIVLKNGLYPMLREDSKETTSHYKCFIIFLSEVIQINNSHKNS